MQLQSGEPYKTRSLGQAAFLAAVGFRFLRCESITNRQVQFVFENKNGNTSRNASRYFAGGAQVDALEYFNCLEQLKAAIFEHRRSASAASGDQGARRD